MPKTILITGATDGIGLETARRLLAKGHRVLLHGRNPEKLQSVAKQLSATSENPSIESYVADLSQISQVETLASELISQHPTLDVLINNAGVFISKHPRTKEQLDLRFVVNTIAPYLLTRLLFPLLGNSGRVINLSSAAQSPVDLEALQGSRQLDDSAAYAQSKLALTQWTRHLALSRGEQGPVLIAVNPGSFLGSKMVKQAYGRQGKDLGIGADILTRAALDHAFSSANGQYFDNDRGQFASPHPDALDPDRLHEVVSTIEAVLGRLR